MILREVAMVGGRILCWLLLLLCSVSQIVRAEEADEDEDSLPGLIGRYTVGKQQIERIDLSPAFVWDKASPDPRLPDGPFDVAWKGRVLIREAGRYQFSAYVDGEIQITLADKPMLGGTKSSGWITGEAADLDFGEFPLEITYKKTGAAARVQIFWSSDKFPLEPLPMEQLFRDEVRADLKSRDRGRELFETHRCGRCHRVGDQSAMPGPALSKGFAEWNPDWLADWLQHPNRLDKHAKMPRMGIGVDDARAIAAALTQKHPVEAPRAADAKRAERSAAGEVLFHSLGCLACHTHGEHGNAPAWGGGDLTDVGRKRSENWLKTWLSKPQEIAVERRMPTFELTAAEASDLATFLAGTRPMTASRPQTELAQRGDQLLGAFRCSQCHELPGTPHAPEITLIREEPDSKRSCLVAEPDPKRHRPAYPQLSETDREALRSYLASVRQSQAPMSAFERGRQLLVQKNCVACHPRGAAVGIVPTAGAISRHDQALAGQSEALIPPSLNAVGDKLPDAVLKSASSGAQPRRLPWLRVRMPRFHHTEAEQDALLKYLIGHDRIPEGAPVAPAEAKPLEKTSAQRTEMLLAGHALVGGGGFSCVACHRFGKFEPRNVALGTRGSDLMQIGQRMRREYFLRWTRSPLRIVRDMEMPSFDKPVAGVLDASIDRQLRALWEAVNDPDFTVPSDPSVIEQSMRVADGGPARVVRDVFWLSDGGRDRYVARAFTVGFGNQQNVLFDLDSMSLREWWVGDFATQRTQGKSWYWQPGGVRLVEGLGDLPDFVLKSTASDAVLTPHCENGTCGRLQSYAPSARGISLRYEVAFRADESPTSIQVHETWTPLDATSAKSMGWKRAIDARGVPEGFILHLHSPALKNRIGTASVSSSTNANVAMIGLGDGISGPYLPTKASEDATAAIAIEYRNTAEPATVTQPARPVEAAKADVLNVLPGFDARRLPLDQSIMPTAIAWRRDGTLVFTSLKGHVYLARDTDGDGIEDSLRVFEEGLAAPYGVLVDGDDVLVSHKPELLRLRDTDGDGRADVREVVATGWGYSDNYHDWTCGIVRDSRGNLYVGLGSDYTQPKRAKETTLWRGKVLQISPQGKITPIGHAFRYPTGLAIREDDEIFVSDNQGVQNTFNEINHLRLGAHYGVPGAGEEPHTGPAELPAIQVPHPWTRSVNGLVFLPESGANAPKFGPFAGHGVGCEYDSRFLMRFTLQRVGETFQGAAYPFSVPTPPNGVGFDGTLCAGVSPQGDLYVGCIHDSGWLGGLNVGNIVRLRPNGEVPAGIREIEADASGFRVTFTQPIDRERAADPASYTLSGYTRLWEGAYATPDSQRHRAEISKVHVAGNRLSVHLDVERLREGFVYELTVGRIGLDSSMTLWPTVGHYTLNRIPKAVPSQPR